MNFFKILLICTVFSHIAADIQMLINPVNLPENTLPGTQLSRAYDKDVAGKANVYHFLNKTKDFNIDATLGSSNLSLTTPSDNLPRWFPIIFTEEYSNMRELMDELYTFFIQHVDLCFTATLEIDEDYPLLQSLYRMTATDEDTSNGDRLVYSIETQLSGPRKGANSFGVDLISGIVSLSGKDLLDFDAGYHVFQLALRATDKTGLFCQGTLIIKIRNINDEKPQFEPFPLNSINVTENKPVGEIVARVKATDRDEDSNISYSFKTQQEKFGLDPFKATAYFALDLSNGIISKTTEPLLDYETNPKQFQIVVAVRNRENLSLESCVGTITINIKNVNDERPVLTYIPDAPINIYENLPVGTKLVKLTATDRDIGDSVHYEFIGTQKEFSINEDSGEVMTAYPLDYEDAATPHSWILYFRVYDNGRVHSTTGTLTVILQDVNDNPPHCPRDIYAIELPENIPVETLVVCLICTDKDGTVPNNNITYNLIKDTFSNETFTLTNNELRVGPTHLDYDNAVFAGMHFKYTLFVKVSDEGRPVLSTMITIIIRVSRINELNPIGTTSAFTFSVFENSPADTLVGRITFTDADWPFNNIKYTIIGGNLGSPHKFYIEPDTGMIKLLESLDRETESQYKIAVRITDFDNDAVPDPLRQRSGTAQVTVNVLNMNDEPPICNPPHLETQINSTIKIPFIQLNCSDKDSPQEELSYSIVGGNTNNQFTLWRQGVDPPSLATTQNFHYDVYQGTQDPMTFQLLIEVTDELGGKKASQLSATTTVIIHVFPWTTLQPTFSTKTTTATKHQQIDLSLTTKEPGQVPRHRNLLNSDQKQDTKPNLLPGNPQ
ncbi:Cadherin-related family member 3 [Manis javanica]|nr:Cadherin-related family member 3 [Manis javanica]